MTAAEKYIQIQSIVVVVAITLLMVKFAAYLLTHSVAILTDALESIVNVVAGLLGLYSLLVVLCEKNLFKERLNRPFKISQPI